MCTLTYTLMDAHRKGFLPVGQYTHRNDAEDAHRTRGGCASRKEGGDYSPPSLLSLELDDDVHEPRGSNLGNAEIFVSPRLPVECLPYFGDSAEGVDRQLLLLALGRIIPFNAILHFTRPFG